MKAIKEFNGQHRWLSNFWPTPVMFENMFYGSVENAYQAAKCLDKEQRVKFLSCTASAAKKAGRRVTLRDGWDEMKLRIMEELVRDKFQRSPSLTQRLIDTGDAELTEGNYWNDTFWGVCSGKGENHLGKILMKIRGEVVVAAFR